MACITQIGPGISVMTFNSSVFGRAKIVSGIVPVEPLIHCLIHHIYSPRWQPTFVAKFILYSLAVEVFASPTYNFISVSVSIENAWHGGGL